jgi:zinc protease
MINLLKRTAVTSIVIGSFLPALAQTIPVDPAVRVGKLPNGFTYYIRNNAEPQKRVMMYLVNKVGSVLEDDDQQGLAHFMEHMNFNGTKNYPKNQLVDYLQKAGVRFGADLNAHTSFDETVYELPIPTDDPAMTASGLKIMRDWAQEATLYPTEI